MNMNSMNNKLHPYWITGFTDGEGCFYIGISKNSGRNIGWRVSPGFEIRLHLRDKNLILQIKSFFKDIGTIGISKDNIYYRVNNVKDILEIIIPHFEKYSLITQKQGDFILWKEIIKLIYKKEHLNKNGFMQILNLRASLNRGPSNKLKQYFPNIIKKKRPKITLPINIDYNWIAGFYSGEGCFHIYISKSLKNNLKPAVHLLLYINQHSRDEALINNLKRIFECGYTFNHSSNNARVFSVTKFKDLYEKIIPFFKQYKIIGTKALDFEDFCIGAELINKKAHLTTEGLKLLQAVKLKMNKNRYNK
jgi:hypothetical protein